MSYSKQECYDLVSAEAKKQGLSAEAITVLKRIMNAESAGDVKAKAKKDRSSATGLFQVIDGTWDDWAGKLGLDRTDSKNGDGRFDPKQQAIFGVAFIKHNEAELTKSLGRKPNAGELYLAHFAGDGGAKRLLAADDNTPITAILSADAIKANGVKEDKNGNIDKGVRLKLADGEDLLFKDFTIRDIKIWANRKMAQPDGYEAMTAEERAKYRKENNVPESTPDAFGDMVSFIGKILTAVIKAIGGGTKFIADMFKGGDSNSLPPPPTPPKTAGLQLPPTQRS